MIRRGISNALFGLAKWVAPARVGDSPRDRHEAAEFMAAEAYQVIGYLSYALDEPAERPTDAEIERALDYFSDGEFREDFLPWPVFPVGFFAKLDAEQQKAALEYRGPDEHGDPAFLRDRA